MLEVPSLLFSAFDELFESGDFVSCFFFLGQNDLLPFP